MSQWPHDEYCEGNRWLGSSCRCLERLIASAAAQLREATATLSAVQALIDAAKAVSPSDRMTVYVGDLEHALGQRDQQARTRTGANVSGDAGGAEQ